MKGSNYWTLCTCVCQMTENEKAPSGRTIDKMTQKHLTSLYLFYLAKVDKECFSKLTKGHEQHEVVET